MTEPLTFKGKEIVFDDDLPPSPVLDVTPAAIFDAARVRPPDTDLCTVCGLPLEVGDWPCVRTIRPHGRSVQNTVFVPYFDVALGVQVDSLAQRWRLMKPEMDGDEVSRGKLEYRDKMSKGDLSARNDRIHERLQAKDRAARG